MYPSGEVHAFPRRKASQISTRSTDSHYQNKGTHTRTHMHTRVRARRFKNLLRPQCRENTERNVRDQPNRSVLSIAKKPINPFLALSQQLWYDSATLTHDCEREGTTRKFTPYKELHVQCRFLPIPVHEKRERGDERRVKKDVCSASGAFHHGWLLKGPVLLGAVHRCA